MSTQTLKIAKEYLLNNELKRFINDRENFKSALFMAGEHSAVGVNITHDFYIELSRNIPLFVGNINTFFSYLIYVYTKLDIIEKIKAKCYPHER